MIFPQLHNTDFRKQAQNLSHHKKKMKNGLVMIRPEFWSSIPKLVG